MAVLDSPNQIDRAEVLTDLRAWPCQWANAAYFSLALAQLACALCNVAYPSGNSAIFVFGRWSRRTFGSSQMSDFRLAQIEQLEDW